MLSQIIKSYKGYEEYLNKYLVPLSLSGDIEATKQRFVQSILAREKLNITFLTRYLQTLDPGIRILGATHQDKLNHIEMYLLDLKLHDIVTLLAFINTRKLGSTFFNVNGNINFTEFKNTLTKLYFNKKNKWELSTTTPFSIISIEENDEGFLLLLTKRGKEIKYVNERQELIVDRKTLFFNIFISKNSSGFITIGGIQDKKQIDFISEYIRSDLLINIGKKLIFLDAHYDIFNSIADTVTRKGEIETKGKNEIQNNSSRNTSQSDLRSKDFNGDPTSIGGNIQIPTVGSINIGFDGGKQIFTISKNNILADEYIKVISFFYTDIHQGKEREKSIYDIFQFIINGKSELITVEPDDFFDKSYKKKKEIEGKYQLTFDMCAKAECPQCEGYMTIYEHDLPNPIVCPKCSKEFKNISDVHPYKYYLTINNKFYEDLFHEKFEDIKNNGKKAIFKKAVNHEEWNFVVTYGNIENKRGLVTDYKKHEINIYLSPLFHNEDEDEQFIINAKSKKAIMLYFDLAIFDTLKNKEERNALFNKIIDALSNKVVHQTTAYIDMRTQDNFTNATFNGAAVKSDNTNINPLSI